jgi:type II secretory pathway component GspD/PulD (secretin)
MKRTTSILAITIALFLCGPIARSQDASACSKNNVDACPAQVFYLNNNFQTSDINNISTVLRNGLPNARFSIYSNTDEFHTIVVHATPDDLAAAQKIVSYLDRPKKNYRLTYTVTEMDGGKQIGVQHYTIMLASGQATSLKLGNKVPIATGPASAQMTPFTYIDVGMNIDATLTELGENTMLKSSVDRSSVAPEKSDTGGGTQQPVIRQATLKGESLLAPGKSVALGSLDIPGSTSHLNVDVVMDPLP